MRRAVSIKPRSLAKSDRNYAPYNDRTAVCDQSPTNDSTFVCGGIIRMISNLFVFPSKCLLFNKRNVRKRYDMRQWRHSDVFIVNFGHALHLLLLFLLLTLRRGIYADLITDVIEEKYQHLAMFVNLMSFLMKTIVLTARNTFVLELSLPHTDELYEKHLSCSSHFQSFSSTGHSV